MVAICMRLLLQQQRENAMWPQYLLDPNTIEFILFGKAMAKHGSWLIQVHTPIFSEQFSSKKLQQFVCSLFHHFLLGNVCQYVASPVEKSTFPLGFVFAFAVCTCLKLHSVSAFVQNSLSLSLLCVCIVVDVLFFYRIHHESVASC